MNAIPKFPKFLYKRNRNKENLKKEKKKSSYTETPGARL